MDAYLAYIDLGDKFNRTFLATSYRYVDIIAFPGIL